MISTSIWKEQHWIGGSGYVYKSFVLEFYSVYKTKSIQNYLKTLPMLFQSKCFYVYIKLKIHKVRRIIDVVKYFRFGSDIFRYVQKKTKKHFVKTVTSEQSVNHVLYSIRLFKETDIYRYNSIDQNCPIQLLSLNWKCQVVAGRQLFFRITKQITTPRRKISQLYKIILSNLKKINK